MARFQDRFSFGRGHGYRVRKVFNSLPLQCYCNFEALHTPKTWSRQSMITPVRWAQATKWRNAFSYKRWRKPGRYTIAGGSTSWQNQMLPLYTPRLWPWHTVRWTAKDFDEFFDSAVSDGRRIA